MKIQIDDSFFDSIEDLNGDLEYIEESIDYIYENIEDTSNYEESINDFNNELAKVNQLIEDLELNMDNFKEALIGMKEYIKDILDGYDSLNQDSEFMYLQDEDYDEDNDFE